MTVEWDAEIIEDRPNELIAWRSVGGAGGQRRVGAVRAGAGRPGHRGPRRDALRPAGRRRRRSWFAKLFGESPEQQVYDDLRRFKQVMETGEVVLSDGSFDGSRHACQRPAQPPASVAAGGEIRSRDGRRPARRGPVPHQTRSERGGTMKANRWISPGKTRVERVPDPKILNARDAIVRITSTAICGSDLHLYNGFIPTMEPGDILGHEFMGEVVEVGPGVKNLKVGDRVVVAVPDRLRQLLPVRAAAVLALRELQPERLDGREAVGPLARGRLRLLAPARRLRRRPGRVRARAVRRRRPDQDPRRHRRTSRSCSSPTSSRPATWAAEMCDIKPGDVIAVWGCGPVGQFAIASAYLLGAERVIAHRSLPLPPADGARAGRRETINYEEEDVYETLMEMTGGRGPDCLHRRRRHGGARARR